MSFRCLPILLLLLTPFATSAQTGTWWYPLGNLGATRQAGDSSRDQDTSHLNIKWRTTALRNSPTVLVGGIRSSEGDLSQQVVGLAGDTLVILSSTGREELKRPYQPQLFQSTPNVRLTLTGLFNTADSTPTPAGRPNVIGIGVERNQKVGASSVELYGMLVDGNGDLYKKLGINIPVTAPEPNQSAAVYPVAAFTPKSSGRPIGLAVVSQNEFTFPAVDTMANGIRRYDLSSTLVEAEEKWSFRVAPRTYAQAPALLKDSPDSTFISLSTAAYASNAITVYEDEVGAETNSGRQYSVTILADSATTPLRFDAREVLLANEFSPGEVHSYVVKLAFTQPVTAPDGTYRILTENHDVDRTGDAEIGIMEGKTRVQNFLARFSSPTRQDIGWSILQADVDRRAPDGEKYRNNPGNEIIAALRSLDGSDVKDDTLYVIRFLENIFNTAIPRQAFSGRLMAAGDLVTDADGRDEIIIANGDTLKVLQLKDYSDRTFDEGDIKQPFRTIRSFTLDSRILYVAIADLEGDGDNDIIVSTATATYAIGKPVPEPFGTLAPTPPEACAPEEVEVRWKRVIGGEGSVTVKLLQEGTGDTVLSSSHPALADSFRVATSGLAEGTYRLIIQDNDLQGLIDTSATFTIHAPSIAPFDIPDKAFQAPYLVGETVTFPTILRCLDTFHVDTSYNGSTWGEVPATITGTGAQRQISYILGCPPSWQCGESSRIRVWFRLRSDDPTVPPVTDSLQLEVPSVTLTLKPGPEDTTGAPNRRLEWPPDSFHCDSVTISYSIDRGNTWHPYGRARSADGYDSILVPMEIAGPVMLRLCCDGGDGTACEYGTTEFTVRELPDINFVAPNPFNPNHPVSDYGNGAAIVYRLKQSGDVRITIFDASRAVTAVLVGGEERQEERTYVQLWDGRNARGEIVANGTYICVIESSSTERIILPIIIMQR